LGRTLTALVAVSAVASLALGDADTLDPAALSAGSFTTVENGANAYAVPISMLDKEQAEIFIKGKEQFNEAWVFAPEPGGVWGLGPTFNEDRCAHCHENNGRAKAAEQGQEAALGLLVRLSIPGTTKEGGPNPHPAYGDQLQNRGMRDRVPAEGRAIVTYSAREMSFADGEKATLRVPQIQFQDLQFGELGQDIDLAAIAPAVVGLGLLEGVPEATILDIAKEQEKLGVQGRPNYVWDYEAEQTVLGRFGWKANQPSLRQQTASAFLGDIGATSSLFPEENCPAVQKQCQDVPSASKCGGQGGCTGNYRPEVIPSRQQHHPTCRRLCPRPAQRERRRSEARPGAVCPANSAPATSELKTGGMAVPAAADLVIHPTDCSATLGEELADGRPDYKATGREWRTPPLWGIGLLRTVNGHSDLLHDGRARGVAEAILWHGGQAEKAREAFRTMPKADRAALVKFVESL
jgi:CxxC motif-containing protein (DUF1111 family)